jgi:hypothetical protein
VRLPRPFTLFVALVATLLTVPTALAQSDPTTRAAVFAGAGVWVDIYDATIHEPQYVVDQAVAHQVTTIYWETSNYHSPADIMYPDDLRQVIALAHAQGIKVVPWYLPGYRNIKLDRRRFAAAINAGGADPIDGLGVDIEADIVRNRQLRATRAAQMVQWLRTTYPDLPMAGIVPRDALAWWRIFPYAEIRANTDVMMPMCYTSRYLTPAQTTAMSADCVTTIRTQTGDPTAPVHVIAGVTDFLKPRLLIAAARGARDAGAMGFSLYNLETTTTAGWRALDVWRTPGT